MNKIEFIALTVVFAALGAYWTINGWFALTAFALAMILAGFYSTYPERFTVRRFGLIHRYTAGYVHGGRHRLR